MALGLFLEIFLFHSSTIISHIFLTVKKSLIDIIFDLNQSISLSLFVYFLPFPMNATERALY